VDELLCKLLEVPEADVGYLEAPVSAAHLALDTRKPALIDRHRLGRAAKRRHEQRLIRRRRAQNERPHGTIDETARQYGSTRHNAPDGAPADAEPERSRAERGDPLTTRTVHGQRPKSGVCLRPWGRAPDSRGVACAVRPEPRNRYRSKKGGIVKRCGSARR